MASITGNVKTTQTDCFKQIFGGPNCTGICIYKWNPNTGQYELQPGSSCSGGTSCRSCSLTLSPLVYGLVRMLGKGCFPDPDSITFNCGVDVEGAVNKAVRAIKIHQLLVKLLIGLSVVSVLSIAGIGYMFFLR